MDKDYIDAKVEAVRAQNDARFSEIRSDIIALGAKIDAKPVGATWWQNALIVAGAVGTVFAVLAYASDRFDSGVGSMGAVEEAIDAQREINASQDGRLDRILEVLEEQGTKSQESPPDGQD